MKERPAIWILNGFCACLSLGQFPGIPVRAQAAPPVLKTLEISEQNADLLNHLQDYRDLEVLSINCMESLQSLPETIGILHKLREWLWDEPCDS